MEEKHTLLEDGDTALIEAGEDIVSLSFNPTGTTVQTVLGLATSTSSMEMGILFSSEEFWDLHSADFHKLKEKGSFFPVRRKLPAFIDNVWKPYGWLPNFPSYVQDSPEEKQLSPRGLAVMRRYTSEGNWFCTRINLLLALDQIKDMNIPNNTTQQYAHYVGELKACLGWQTPKWSGLAWRGALHSPVELFMMATKGIFFIPSFVSTSISPKCIIFDRFKRRDYDEEIKTGQPKGHQNCIFEFDTSEWPDFSSLLLDPSQAEYCETERENLLSCYNVYEWVGYQMIKYNGKESPLIRLKIRNYDNLLDFEKQALATENYPVDASWVKKRGATFLQREWSPKQLNRKFLKLRERYIAACVRENKPIPKAFRGEATEEDVKLGFLDDEVHSFAENLAVRPEQDQNETMLHKKQMLELVAKRAEQQQGTPVKVVVDPRLENM